MSSATSLEDWTARLAEALGLDEDSAGHVQAILDLAQDAAHTVGRPAAPVTAFLVGLAAGQAGGDHQAVKSACTTAQRLAQDLTEHRANG